MFNRLPSFVRAVISPFAIGRQKMNHYGQVVPIEDNVVIMIKVQKPSGNSYEDGIGSGSSSAVP